MNHARFRLAFRSLLSGLLLLVGTGPAWANYYELLRRVPESANTLIMIDVERMLMSPIAMKEKWRDKANSAEGQVLHFPINAKRYMLASKLDFVAQFRQPLGHCLDRDDRGRFAAVPGKVGRGLHRHPRGPGDRLLAPQRLLRVVQAHDPGRLVPGQPPGRGTVGAIAPAPREAADLGLSPERGHAGAWQESHRRRDGPGRPAHEPPGPRQAAARREPRGQAGRSRHAHQGVHIHQGRDHHGGGDRETERQDPARSRRVVHPDQGRRQGPDPRGAREERHAARRDEGLETSRRGQGGLARGTDEPPRG